MRVRLTRIQYRSCLEVVRASTMPCAENLAVFLEVDVADAGRTRLDVVLPAIGWQRVREALFDVCYTDRGFRARGAPLRIVNALKAITESVNRLEVHPALRGAGMIGLHTTIIPAWAIGENLWSPYPVESVEMVLLAPRHTTTNGHRITHWQPTDLPGASSFVFHEISHLAFA